MAGKSRKSSTQKRGLVKTKTYAEVLKLGKSPRNKRALIENYNRLAETVNRQFRRHNKAFPDGSDFTRLFLATVKGRSIRPIKEKTRLTTKDIVQKSQLLYRLYNHPKYSIKAVQDDNYEYKKLYDKLVRTDWAKNILIPPLKQKKGESITQYLDRQEIEIERRKENFRQFVNKGYLKLLNKFYGYREAMEMFDKANVTDKSFAVFMQDMNIYVKGKVSLDEATSHWRVYSEPEKETLEAMQAARENYFVDVIDEYGNYEGASEDYLINMVKGSESIEDLYNAADAQEDDDIANILREIAEVKKSVEDYYKRRKNGKGTKRK